MSSVRGNVSIKFFLNAPVIPSTELFSLLSIVAAIETKRRQRMKRTIPTYVKIRTRSLAVKTHLRFAFDR